MPKPLSISATPVVVVAVVVGLCWNMVCQPLRTTTATCCAIASAAAAVAAAHMFPFPATRVVERVIVRSHQSIRSYKFPVNEKSNLSSPHTYDPQW